ncbi:hypothetical protein J1N09_06670 [Aureitalea sp. L0-47]|uniref:hypothetical protein n=1 Tax=Aureitalea sp. L0-47 TaxID=2816962 RepID=UPI00223910C4|nr:hypothetical protein [Aureitalea sp. L0-47]MCW5519514.1 hypothetical protein [Aureitalea sp. L0-47]
MNLIKRIAWYSGGFVIGIIVLLFFLGGKKASCDYGPTARTLKNIRTKNIVLSEQALNQLAQYSLDSSAVHTILKKGDVIFSESNTSLDSCKIYAIQGELEKVEVKFFAENCSDQAKIDKITINRLD